MAQATTHLFSSFSIRLMQTRPMRTRISTITSIQLYSSSSMWTPYKRADRIVFPPLSNSRVDSDWSPPLRVSCVRKDTDSYMKRFDYYNTRKAGTCPRLVLLKLYGVEVDTEEKLNDLYIKTLAYALGSEGEAKRRIYLASYGCCYAFGAEFDFDALEKLQKLTYVSAICGDLDRVNREKDRNDESDVRFVPMNLNFRLNNIFTYHHLSARSSKWNFDHWLISINLLNGVPTPPELERLCIKMLMEVFGSEKEAREKIYAVWYTSPVGFGAEIDQAVAKKLQGRADVFKVFPDYAFDVKGRCSNDGLVLHIQSSAYVLTFSSYLPGEDSISKDCFVSLEEHYGNNRYVPLICPPIKQMLLPYNDLFSYHYMNEMNSNWRSDQWLIHVKHQDDEWTNEEQFLNFCTRILGQVTTKSEKELKMKIYIVWCKMPFGFGAHVDEKTANELKGHPDVLLVLPDYGFHIKRRNSPALLISRSLFMEEEKIMQTIFYCGFLIDEIAILKKLKQQPIDDVY